MATFYTSLWLFFCYAFLGWLGETALAAVRQRRYVDRSLLFGPVCIAYGIAGPLIGAALRELSGNWFFLFLGSAIYAGVIEWLAGHWLYKLTGTRWWDYSGHPWNLDGYVCAASAALWGVLGVVVVKWGNGLLLALAGLIPPLALHILLWCLLAVLALDALATALTLAGLAHRLPRVEEMGNRLEAVTVRLGLWVLRKTEGRIRKTYPQADFAKKREKSAAFAAGCGFYKLFWLFFIGAFLGDIVETLFVRATAGVWQSRSSLVWGDLSLVWGFAMALASLLLHRYRERSDSFLFLAGTLLGGAYEYFCSVFTELVFGVVFWDYSHIPFNLAGRVNLLYCFFWGMAAVAWIRVVYPRLSALIEKIPKKIGRPLTWALVVFLIADMAVSAAALGRMEQRRQGLPPQNAVEEYLDAHYGDERLNAVYPAVVKTE